MSTYRIEWECCGSVTETESWTPDSCPFCTEPVVNPTNAGPVLPDFDEEGMRAWLANAITTYAHRYAEQVAGPLIEANASLSEANASLRERVAELERELHRQRELFTGASAAAEIYEAKYDRLQAENEMLREAVGKTAQTKAEREALPQLKQYRDAAGQFYFKLLSAEGELLLQSAGYASPKEAGQALQQLRQCNPAALREGLSGRVSDEALQEISRAFAVLQAAEAERKARAAREG